MLKSPQSSVNYRLGFLAISDTSKHVPLYDIADKEMKSVTVYYTRRYWNPEGIDIYEHYFSLLYCCNISCNVSMIFDKCMIIIIISSALIALVAF